MSGFLNVKSSAEVLCSTPNRSKYPATPREQSYNSPPFLVTVCHHHSLCSISFVLARPGQRPVSSLISWISVQHWNNTVRKTASLYLQSFPFRGQLSKHRSASFFLFSLFALCECVYSHSVSVHTERFYIFRDTSPSPGFFAGFPDDEWVRHVANRCKSSTYWYFVSLLSTAHPNSAYSSAVFSEFPVQWKVWKPRNANWVSFWIHEKQKWFPISGRLPKKVREASRRLSWKVTCLRNWPHLLDWVR